MTMATNTVVTRQSQNARLLKFFKTGRDISARQAEYKFGIFSEDVAKRVYDLRQDGYPIYTNRKQNQYGETVTRYRLGTAPRSLVAAGVAAAGASALTA